MTEDFYFNFQQIIMGFVNDVERCCDKKMHTIDIGGGLSTDFDNGPEPKGFEFTTYRRELEMAAPGRIWNSLSSI